MTIANNKLSNFKYLNTLYGIINIALLLFEIQFSGTEINTVRSQNQTENDDDKIFRGGLGVKWRHHIIQRL
jgi:hypothetical protein